MTRRVILETVKKTIFVVKFDHIGSNSLTDYIVLTCCWCEADRLRSSTRTFRVIEEERLY